MSMTLLLAALAAQAPSAPTIEVAQADWAQFERIDSRLHMPNDRMVRAVETMLRRGECTLPGQNPRRFDIDVNYAIRMDAANRPQRIVVQDIGCRPLETLVGGIVADMMRYDYFRMPAAGAARWYSNTINFNLAT